MRLDGFIYSYNIIEVGADKENPIAVYRSNAAPPAIGTVLTLSESMGYSTPIKFKVVAVEMLPGKAPHDKRGTSTFTLVNVEVALLDERRHGERRGR